MSFWPRFHLRVWLEGGSTAVPPLKMSFCPQGRTRRHAFEDELLAARGSTARLILSLLSSSYPCCYYHSQIKWTKFPTMVSIHLNDHWGKEKDDYLTGASAAPETMAPTYKKWMAENNMVMSWLVNSMTPDIGENFLSVETAKEI
uniref:Retrotransposon Copia-like N-terminal domain-containing protein n=1 Tax=Ananas comosus var. bracteatus TaxID=296719 RepID=A0A6V7QLJ5_ANACO|nr:unnamed protein product [Ananas comosus var. bracteatus]